MFKRNPFITHFQYNVSKLISSQPSFGFTSEVTC